MTNYLEWIKLYNKDDNNINYIFSDNRFKKIGRRDRFKAIKYQDLWFKILVDFHKLFKNTKIILEVYPSMAGEIRGTLAEEVNILEEKYKNKSFFLKTQNNTHSYLYDFIFNIDDYRDLDDLIYRYSESYQLIIYFVNDKFDYNNFIKTINTGTNTDRAEQFSTFYNIGCELIAEFNSIATEMKITVKKEFEGYIYLLLKDYSIGRNIGDR